MDSNINILLEYLQLRKWVIESEESGVIRGRTEVGAFVAVIHNSTSINKDDANRYCEYTVPHIVIVADKTSAPRTREILDTHFTKVEIIPSCLVRVNILNHCDQPVFLKVNAFPPNISDDNACIMSNSDPVAIVLGYEPGTKVRAEFKCPASGSLVTYYLVTHSQSGPERSNGKRDPDTDE